MRILKKVLVTVWCLIVFLPLALAADSLLTSVTLAPYGFKVIKISEMKEPLVDTNLGWWKEAVVYQTMVRSYMDSDGDGIGDFKGMTEKLDYLTNIGFTTVWTLPVFASPSYHGYDTVDYYAINPPYGTMDDFTNYTATAHQKGMHVILDMVINHSSTQNPWFIDSVRSANGKRDWFVWTNAAMKDLMTDQWQVPWGGGNAGKVWHRSTDGWYYYGAFWSGMPDLNLNNHEVQRELTNVAKFWFDRGADGYRLDAVRYAIEEGPFPAQADTLSSLQFWKWYKASLKALKHDSYLVGEAWTKQITVEQYYQGGEGLDGCFSFDFQGAIANSLRVGLARPLSTLILNRPTTAPMSFFAPFLDNHDSIQGNNRIADSVPEGSYKLCAALLMTFPGTPFVYYGTELGMKKGPENGDPAKRTPMLWDDTENGGFTKGIPWEAMAEDSGGVNVRSQMTNPDSLLRFYKKAIALRKSESALCRGDIRLVKCTNRSVLVYLRPGPDGTILVIANMSDQTNTANLDFAGSGIKIDPKFTTKEVLIP